MRVARSICVAALAAAFGVAASPPVHAALPDASVVVAATPNPSASGQQVSIIARATLAGVPRSATVGTVTFLDGTEVLATADVERGSARLRTGALGVGDHTITAAYLAPGATEPAVSSPIVQRVDAGSTTVVLSSARPNAYTAQSGAVVARARAIAPASGVPTGTVDFYVDGEWWWTESLDTAGRAALPYASLGVGSWSVVAVYSGDGNLSGSTSTALTQTVRSSAPTVSATFTPATVAAGEAARLVISARNPLPFSMPSAGMGVQLPPGATLVSWPDSCRRAWPNLFYCAFPLPRGASRSIVVDVRAPAAPTTVSVSGYARNLETMDETAATAVLAVE